MNYRVIRFLKNWGHGILVVLATGIVVSLLMGIFYALPLFIDWLNKMIHTGYGGYLLVALAVIMSLAIGWLLDYEEGRGPSQYKGPTDFVP